MFSRKVSIHRCFDKETKGRGSKEKSEFEDKGKKGFSGISQVCTNIKYPLVFVSSFLNSVNAAIRLND